MEHVCEPGARAVIDVRFASDDLGNHRQATDERGERVADAHREKIFVQVRFAAPRIDLIDGLRAQERLDTSDQRKHDDVLDADRCEYAGEIRESQCAEHVARHVHEEARPEGMVLPSKRDDLLAADIEIHPERNRDQ